MFLHLGPHDVGSAGSLGLSCDAGRAAMVSSQLHIYRYHGVSWLWMVTDTFGGEGEARNQLPGWQGHLISSSRLRRPARADNYTVREKTGSLDASSGSRCASKHMARLRTKT